MEIFYPISLVLIALVYHIGVTVSQNNAGTACNGGISLTSVPGFVNLTGLPTGNSSDNESVLCSWNISAPTGRIAIKFLTFNIGVGESKSFCDGNAVRVHDGVRWLSFCGAAPLETSYTCQGGVLRVQYVSDGTRQASTPVFSIKYFSPPGLRHAPRSRRPARPRVITDSCHQPEALALEYNHDMVLSLHDYEYQNNCDKTWSISSRPGTAIQVKVVGTIEDEALCRYDNLTLSSGHCEDHDIPALNATCYRFGCLCGTLTAARVYKSVCNKLQIRFISDHTVTRSGFDLYIKVIPDQRPSARSTPRTTSLPCGRSRAFISSRITGGQEVFPHRFPWQVALFYNNGLTCGGSLIASRWVLTAAHCVDSVRARSMLMVKIGRHDINNDTEPGVNAAVTQIIMRCDYDRVTYDNDIALLRLDREVLFGDIMLPICLPDSTDLPAGRACHITGWGSTSEGVRDTVRHLRSGEVVTVSDGTCRSNLSQYVVTPNMICAASLSTQNRADACWGDSGGPLITKVPASCQAVQFGLVSWGDGCARQGKPGVYTRVYNYVGWIDLVTRGQSGQSVISRLNPSCYNGR